MSKVHTPAADKPPAPVKAEPGPAKFRVKLRDNPELTVEAADRLDAIGVYNKECGILSTTNTYDITRVEA